MNHRAFSQSIRRAFAIAGLLSFAMCARHALATDFRTGQESVGTVTPEAIGNSVSRYDLVIFNTDAANPVFCGKSGVTSTTGQKIPAITGYTWENQPGGQPAAGQPIFCIATGATVTVTFWENLR